jgi:hypothetical protein
MKEKGSSAKHRRRMHSDSDHVKAIRKHLGFRQLNSQWKRLSPIDRAVLIDRMLTDLGKGYQRALARALSRHVHDEATIRYYLRKVRREKSERKKSSGLAPKNESLPRKQKKLGIVSIPPSVEGQTPPATNSRASLPSRPSPSGTCQPSGPLMSLSKDPKQEQLTAMVDQVADAAKKIGPFPGAARSILVELRDALECKNTSKLSLYPGQLYKFVMNLAGTSAVALRLVVEAYKRIPSNWVKLINTPTAL